MKNKLPFLLLLAGLTMFACKETAHKQLQDPTEVPPGEGRDDDIEGVELEAPKEIDPASIPANYEKLTWQDLADVQYEVRYYEEAQDSMLFPNFGPIPLAKKNQQVHISGYVIPVSYDRYVLSANPFSSCFFCGNAGPESVVELALTTYEEEMFFTDEFRTFTGTLTLNDTDIDKLNYILTEAAALD